MANLLNEYWMKSINEFGIDLNVKLNKFKRFRNETYIQTWINIWIVLNKIWNWIIGFWNEFGSWNVNLGNWFWKTNEMLVYKFYLKLKLIWFWNK